MTIYHRQIKSKSAIHVYFQVISLDTECYVLPYPENDDDAEELPEFAVQNNLEFVYRDELFQDVISAAVDEDEDIPNKKIKGYSIL